MPRTADRLAERLFLAGSGIYLAAFTLNSNFDYRLIFVLLCIPWLASSRCGRGMATTLLVCCLVASNAFLTTSLLGLFWGGLLAQAGNSALYIGLAVLLILQLLSRSPQTAALRPACNSLHSTYPPCPGS